MVAFIKHEFDLIKKWFHLKKHTFNLSIKTNFLYSKDIPNSGAHIYFYKHNFYSFKIKVIEIKFLETIKFKWFNTSI